MTKTRQFAILGLFFLISISLKAQSIKGYSNEQINELSSKVESQVRFLEYLLNTIGNSETPARDKDVIIRESFLKIFRDAKVQVEDDLLLDRKVITNKDVIAYLKDIEFFYKNIEFKLKIREIKPGQKENGEVYFLASLDRTITAVGLRGEKIVNTKPRFIEVNLNDKSQEIKIVSIYTTKVSRDEELKAWWGSLDQSWKSYFIKRFNLANSDTIGLEYWHKFVSVDSLNLSGNKQISTLNPLSELRDLKHLNISHTSITNLGPISNVTLLESLDISNTSTSSVQFIKYSDRIKYLDLSNTLVENINELLNLKSITVLKLKETKIQSFNVLNEFKNLLELNLSESGFNNLENIKDLIKLEKLNLSSNYMINPDFIAGLTSLKNLDLSNSNFKDLNVISNLVQLEILDVTRTQISDLGPLEKLSSLKKVAADETKLSQKSAIEFVRKNPNILLIHDVKDLNSWWQTLPLEWKVALKKANPAIKNDQPGIEVLTQTVTLTTLNLDNSGIETLNPIVRFVNLSDLSFSGNPEIKDLLALTEVRTLKRVTGKNTSVKDISILVEVPLLTQIDLEGSPIQSILALTTLDKLTFLNVNGSTISYEEVPQFILQKPEVNVIFRTTELNSWWENLDADWKDLFRIKYQLPQNPSTEQLHKLTASAELSFERVIVKDLSPLTIFHNLRKLSIFDAPISSISPVSEMNKLTSLRLSQIPILDFLPISDLSQLDELDLSNTGIENLITLSRLTNLKKLNLSGTNLKSLKGLESLLKLEELDVASTNLRSLKPIEGLTNLKKLICFNTRLVIRTVDAFKLKHPSCEVRYY
jgi:Leucine-rich repeat (LRR) protein